VHARHLVEPCGRIAVAGLGHAPVERHRAERAARERRPQDRPNAREAGAGGQQHEVLDSVGGCLPDEGAMGPFELEQVRGPQRRETLLGEQAARHAADMELEPVRFALFRRPVGDREAAALAVLEHELRMLAWRAAERLGALQLDHEPRDLGRERFADQHLGRMPRWRERRRAPVREAQPQVAGGAALAHQQFARVDLIGRLRRRRDALDAAFEQLRAARTAFAALAGERHGHALRQRRVEQAARAIEGKSRALGREGAEEMRGLRRHGELRGRNALDANLNRMWSCL
jgi:hypothetical protein